MRDLNLLYNCSSWGLCAYNYTLSRINKMFNDTRMNFTFRVFSPIRPTWHREHGVHHYFSRLHTVPIMDFQKWNCAASFPIPKFMYLWPIYMFPGSACLFGCSKIGRPILGILYINRPQIHECGNWETEHYNSFLEITWPWSFFSGNT
jgi:hypothetical protein